MENHHVSWENPLFQWPFSIAMLVHQRVLVFAEWVISYSSHWSVHIFLGNLLHIQIGWNNHQTIDSKSLTWGIIYFTLWPTSCIFYISFSTPAWNSSGALDPGYKSPVKHVAEVVLKMICAKIPVLICADLRSWFLRVQHFEVTIVGKITRPGKR